MIAKILHVYYLLAEWMECWWYWWYLELQVKRTEKGLKGAKNMIKSRSSKWLSDNAKKAWIWTELWVQLIAMILLDLTQEILLLW